MTWRHGAGRIERTLPRNREEGRMEATALERKLSELDCPFEIEVHIRDCKESRTAGPDRGWEEKELRREAEYFAMREEASEAEWDRRLAQRVAESPLRPKHYGVWHPERGWLVNRQQEMIVLTSRAVATAQCHTARRYVSDYWDASLWEVRCIEEWADEQ